MFQLFSNDYFVKMLHFKLPFFYYFEQSSSSYMDKLQKIQLWKAGFFTVVHFPDEHITILWDQRTTVHVQMGHQWQVRESQCHFFAEFVLVLSLCYNCFVE